MSIDWTIYKTDTIFTGSNENGVRFLQLFLTDYKAAFGATSVNASCHSCIREYHRQFNKKFQTMNNNNSGFVLKPKYNGIQLKFGSNIMVSNRNMTDEIGLTLYKNHAAGARLFLSVPKNIDELINPKQSDSDISKLSKAELVQLASEKGITVDPKATKAVILGMIQNFSEEEE